MLHGSRGRDGSAVRLGPVLRSFNKEEKGGIEHNRLSSRKSGEAAGMIYGILWDPGVCKGGEKLARDFMLADRLSNSIGNDYKPSFTLFHCSLLCHKSPLVTIVLFPQRKQRNIFETEVYAHFFYDYRHHKGTTQQYFHTTQHKEMILT